MNHVYIIGLKENLKIPYDKCYIGVTEYPEKRWKAHLQADTVVGRFIRENDLCFKENMRIIFDGDKDDCYMMEWAYRPFPMLGLNEAIGGNGGYTSYTDERNKKISKAHKGRKVTWMYKIVESRGSYAGYKNPHAKKWKLVAPNGKSFDVFGNLEVLCNKKGLLISTLRKHKGHPVPSPKDGVGKGGFRAKNKEHEKKRLKTVGWMLTLVEDI